MSEQVVHMAIFSHEEYNEINRQKIYWRVEFWKLPQPVSDHEINAYASIINQNNRVQLTHTRYSANLYHNDPVVIQPQEGADGTVPDELNAKILAVFDALRLLYKTNFRLA